MAATTSASGPYGLILFYWFKFLSLIYFGFLYFFFYDLCEGTKSKISSVKNAHLAESQAEVVAENALKFYESFKNNSLSKAK